MLETSFKNDEEPDPLMDRREPEAEPHFSQPVRQITSMLIASAIVAAGVYIGFAQIHAIFMSNPYLNGAIVFVFALGVLYCFVQVAQLMRSVQWIEAFAGERIGSRLVEAPSLLAPLATLLRTRGAKMQISSGSSRSILDSVAQRIDEDREITRYTGNILIFLGLLGTFYGLATTVPALVETIRSLSPAAGESGVDVFTRLQQGLESQLGGMGTAFSSSLLGLASSLVVGQLELFAGRGQNRFYRELEEWLSTITRLGYAGGDEGPGADVGIMASFVDHLAEQLETMQAMVAQSDTHRTQLDQRLLGLTAALEQMLEQPSNTQSDVLLTRIADSQDRLLAKLSDVSGDGVDAESRMRLRSIDVQLLKLLEELTAGRQETVAQMRTELSVISRLLRASLTRQGGG
jgi:hypothetical protein